MRRIALAVAILLLAASARGAVPSPHAVEVPRWFTESFLDFREDLREAAGQGKRVLLYFGQDGCPYCKALMKAGFGAPDIEAKTRAHFVAIALNLWGDREVTWVDGRAMTEKELGRVLKVQYTPTLLFLDERGGIALRLNGYLPPDKFRIALDYAAGREEKRVSFPEYLAARTGEKESGTLTAAPYLRPGPPDLPAALKAGKPAIALFERRGCEECRELHREGFARAEVKALAGRFTLVQVDAAGSRPLVAPDGSRTTEARWAQSLGVAYAPSLVFFAPDGKEAFRVEGYVRPFHLASALDYVASGAHRTEPSFQRFVQARADRLRAAGKAVDLWK